MKTVISISAKVPNALQLDRDRIEEDDLDVEQDEQHRDEVEADPEAEALLDLGRQAALVGVLLVRHVALGPEQRVEHRERHADDAAEDDEDDRRQVAVQHQVFLSPMRYVPDTPSA